MKNVANIVGSYDGKAYVDKSIKTKHSDAEKKALSEQKSEPRTDTVRLSNTSKELHTARNAALATPEDSLGVDRANRVEEIRQAVQEGRYKVNFDKVAQKMLNSTHDDFF